MESRLIKHKVIFFYLFAFLISWIFWFGMFFYYGSTETSNSTDYFALLVPSSLGGLGPLISLIILEKLTKKEVEVKKILGTAKIRHEKNGGFFLRLVFIL